MKQMRDGSKYLSEIADNVVLANLPMVRVFSLSVAKKDLNQTILRWGVIQVLEMRETICLFWGKQGTKNHHCSDDVNESFANDDNHRYFDYDDIDLDYDESDVDFDAGETCCGQPCSA